MSRYFNRKASEDLVEAGLHHLRVTASEHIAKLIIDSNPEYGYDLLLKRYKILEGLLTRT